MAAPIDLDATRQATPDGEVPERKKLTLFKLNGRDYKVEAKPSVSLALRFLDDLNKKGEDLAVAAMLPRLLGDEAWQALLDTEDLKMEEFQAIAEAASKLLLGGVDGKAMRDFGAEQ